MRNFSPTLSNPISSTMTWSRWWTPTLPVIVSPVVRSSTSLVFSRSSESAFSLDRSSLRFPAVAAQGVMMSIPIDSAIAKLRALSVTWRISLACLIIPAPQLVAPLIGNSSIPRERAVGSIVWATSVALLWAMLPGWYAYFSAIRTCHPSH